MKKNKIGVSPVIATVLLISMVVVLAMIVILWFTSITGEAITKFEGQNVEIVCRDVSFDASYSSTSGVLSILNTGSVPIFRLKVKEETVGGGFNIDEIDIDENSAKWPPKGLNQGKSYSYADGDYGGNERIVLIPVLLGTSEKGLKTFTCEEDATGYEILILNGK